jgi:DNA invertase Pin-like site-specific DNA recombinase
MKIKPRSNGNDRSRAPWRSVSDRRRPPAFGYASVPADLALEGPEIAAQKLSIKNACERLELDLIDLLRDHEPAAGDREARPGLSYALERIEAGEASCLIVSGLERLSREVTELASLVDRLEQRGIRLIAVDVGLDTATPNGRLILYRRPVPSLPWAPEVEAPATDPAELEPQQERDEGPFEQDEAVFEQDEAVFEPDEAALEPEEAAFDELAEDALEIPEAPARPNLRVVPTPAPAGETAPTGDDEPAGAPEEAIRALGYASVPVDIEGDASGRGLETQRQAIAESCETLGFELVELVRDREAKGGKALDRAGLSYALGRIAAGEASCLVVQSLERLSRSVAELGTLIQWLEQTEVRLVAVDLKLDTATPGGRTTARALASVGGWERERLSERTRKGLAAARAKRREAGGPAAPDWAELRKRIAAMRADGMTLQAIADVLNEEGVPTPRGGAKWRPSSVQTAAGYKRRSRPHKVEDLPAVERSPKGEDESGGEPPPSPAPG